MSYQSRVQYTGTGSVSLYSVPFAYISKAYIEVRVGGSLLTEGVGFSWQSPTSILLLGGNLAAGVVLDIRRKTPSGLKLVDFQDGSVLTEASLDLSNDQVFQLVQETLDDMQDRIAAQPDGTIDAQGRRIKNGATPVNPTDYATKDYVDTSPTDAAVAAAVSAVAAAAAASQASSERAYIEGVAASLDMSQYAPKTGVGASGTWPISVSGSAGNSAQLGGVAPSGYVATSGNQTVGGVKTFSSAPILPAQSMVRLNTANGYGSTNTKIRRFTNVVTNQGADITYTDSASLGASFTINTAGVYSISYSDSFSASSYLGVSRDTTQPSVTILSVSVAERLGIGAASNSGGVTWVGYLTAGTVIRPHTEGTATNIAAVGAFTITKVS